MFGQKLNKYWKTMVDTIENLFLYHDRFPPFLSFMTRLACF